MATLSPLKDLINNSTLGDMEKILKEEPFLKIEIGLFLLIIKNTR